MAFFCDSQLIRPCDPPAENCLIFNKGLSRKEAFLLASFNHHSESARTVTHLQECDLAMSWLSSGQSWGATWGLSQTESKRECHETEIDCSTLSLCSTLSFWMVEKRYRAVRIAILLLFQKCNVPSVRTGLPNLLFNYWALSAVIRRKTAGGAAALDLKYKLFGFLITFL